MGRGLRTARPGVVADGDRTVNLATLTRACDQTFANVCEEIRAGELTTRSLLQLSRARARRIAAALVRDELVSAWLPIPHGVLPNHGSDPRRMMSVEIYYLVQLLDKLSVEEREKIGWPGSEESFGHVTDNVGPWVCEPLLIWLTAHCQDIRDAARPIVECGPSEEDLRSSVERERRAKRRLSIALGMRHDRASDAIALCEEVVEATAHWRREQVLSDLSQARAREYEMRYGALPASVQVETLARLLTRWWNWPSSQRPPQFPNDFGTDRFSERSTSFRDYLLRETKGRTMERAPKDGDILIVSPHPRVPRPILAVAREDLARVERTTLVVNLLATKVPPSLPCLNRGMHPRELTDSCSVPRPLSLATAVTPGTHLRLLTLGETPISTNLVEFRRVQAEGRPDLTRIDLYQDWRYRGDRVPDLKNIVEGLPKTTGLDFVEHDLFVDARGTWVLARSGAPRDLYPDEASTFYDIVQKRLNSTSHGRGVAI